MLPISLPSFVYKTLDGWILHTLNVQDTPMKLSQSKLLYAILGALFGGVCILTVNVMADENPAKQRAHDRGRRRRWA